MSTLKANDDSPATVSPTPDMEPTLVARVACKPAEASRQTKPAPMRATAADNPTHDRTFAFGATNADRWPSVPGYEILAALGHGSMGVVYKARDLSLNRLVALKMIRCPANIAEDTLGRFVAEARMIAALQHPNIIQIYEIHFGAGIPFFAMELADGGSLAERINGKPQPIRQAAEWTQTLAWAIDAAHERGIVHRDLKPANIMLQVSEVRRQDSAGSGQESTEAGQPIESDVFFVSPESGPLGPVLKITDFGLAKQLGQGGGRTESGIILGTPSYMAPEQAEGKASQIGPASDVYGLGAILYELLTGRPPYAGETPLETVLQLFQIEPVAPSRLQPKVPRDLETICLKCLHKEAGKRYPNGGALAEDLRRFLAGEPIKARPASLPERMWKWARRRPTLATLITGVAAAVLALLALTVWHQIDLQYRLAQARLDEGQARDDQEAAHRRERLTVQRASVKDLIHAGEGAMEHKDWYNVHAHLERARGLAAEAPDLADLREQIDRLLATADQHRRDRERLQAFHRHRSEALFHTSLFTGADAASADNETQKAAQAALALVNLAPESLGAPTFDGPHFDAAEKAGLQAGSFELLLILADAVARPVPNQTAAERRRQAKAALGILERAASLGIVARAYHVRRAQLLTWAGRDDDARTERARADSMTPVNELDRFLLATEDYRRGNWQEAVRSLEGVLQTQPDHFWANYYLALCSMKTQRPDLAAARLTACLGWRPELPWLRLMRGSAWAEMNQFARAEEDFAAALKAPLPESADEALRLGPKSPRLLFTTARIYAQAAARHMADAKRDGRAPGVFAEIWQDRAVQLLRQALDMQSAADGARFWKTYVQSDAALQTMRHRYEFTQLASRLARTPE